MSLSETETKTRYITQSIRDAGWTPRQIREEVYFTDGRMIVRDLPADQARPDWRDFVGAVSRGIWRDVWGPHAP